MESNESTSSSENLLNNSSESKNKSIVRKILLLILFGSIAIFGILSLLFLFYFIEKDSIFAFVRSIPSLIGLIIIIYFLYEGFKKILNGENIVRKTLLLILFLYIIIFGIYGILLGGFYISTTPMGLIPMWLFFISILGLIGGIIIVYFGYKGFKKILNGENNENLLNNSSESRNKSIIIKILLLILFGSIIIFGIFGVFCGGYVTLFFSEWFIISLPGLIGGIIILYFGYKGFKKILWGK